MMYVTKFLHGCAVLLVAGVLSGCGSQAKAPSAKPSAEGSAYRLSSEPADAKGVKEVREAVQTDDEITLVGRIGGEASPWIDGQAAFSIVDPVLQPCSAEEGCPTPWDYCCDTDLLLTHKALVKIVDKEGKTVATDARELLGVKELQTVVVHGKAKRDEAGNLTVLADGVFVKP